jgi:hypothetical protein
MVTPERRGDYLNKATMLHIRGPKPKKEKPIPTTGNQEKKRKKSEYKRSVVSPAEQRRIFAELDKKKLSTPKSFWSRILAIIK